MSASWRRSARARRESDAADQDELADTGQVPQSGHGQHQDQPQQGAQQQPEQQTGAQTTDVLVQGRVLDQVRTGLGVADLCPDTPHGELVTDGPRRLLLRVYAVCRRGVRAERPAWRRVRRCGQGDATRDRWAITSALVESVSGP